MHTGIYRHVPPYVTIPVLTWWQWGFCFWVLPMSLWTYPYHLCVCHSICHSCILWSPWPLTLLGWSLHRIWSSLIMHLAWICYFSCAWCQSFLLSQSIYIPPSLPSERLDLSSPSLQICLSFWFYFVTSPLSFSLNKWLCFPLNLFMTACCL